MTNNTQKTTIRSQFIAVREALLANGYNDLADFIDGRIEQVSKKSTAIRKPTPKQIENDGYKADILAWCEPSTTYCAGDVLKGVPSIVASGMSINRVSALLTQLVADGALVKTMDKKKCFYSLA
jgi:hypothetical protein